MTDTSAVEQISDEVIFARMKNNDTGAFAELYNRYHEELYRYCYHTLGNRQQAEDTFHDVVLKMYERRESFDGGNFAKWVFTIARTSCLNVLRNKKIGDEFNELVHQFSLDTDDKNADGEVLHTALHKAIASLPEEFREVLIHKEFNHYSYIEISEIMGITVALAKVRVFRSMKLLQKKLSPYL